MGKYEKLFCFTIPTTLIILGILMGIFSLTIGSINLWIYAINIDRRGDLAGYIYLSCFASIQYIVLGFVHFTLYFRIYRIQNVEREFAKFLTYSVITMSLALGDGTWKFLIGDLPISIALFSYAAANIFVAFIATCAKHELTIKRLRLLQSFNGSQIQASGTGGLPRYPMPLQCEVVQVDHDDAILDDNNDDNDEAPLI